MSLTGRRVCLICNHDYPKSSLINHIAEHLNYKRHKCSECLFQCVLMEAMVDHQNNTGHKVEFDAKHWYLDRVCQMVYSDFEYAQRHGEQTIKRFGSAFGDKQRLAEILRAGEVKEEEDDIEIIDTREVPDSSANCMAPVSSNRRSFSVENEAEQQQPNLTATASQERPRNVNRTFNNPQKQPNRMQQQQKQPAERRRSANIQQLQDLGTIRPERVQTAPADSSNEHPEQTTEQLLAEFHRRITQGEERRKCKICKKMVDNDYRSQKEHVLEDHMNGETDTKKVSGKLKHCFQQGGKAPITNDRQCNICWFEATDKKARYHHVSIEHTNYRWNCPLFPRCDISARSRSGIISHLNTFHKMNVSRNGGDMSNMLKGGDKDNWIMLSSDFEQKLTPLVRKCFPFDLPPNKADDGRVQTKKRRNTKAGKEDDHLDNTISNFMPTAERSALNRTLSNNQQTGTSSNRRMQDDYESSDYTDSEDEPEDAKPDATKEQNLSLGKNRIAPSPSTTNVIDNQPPPIKRKFDSEPTQMIAGRRDREAFHNNIRRGRGGKYNGGGNRVHYKRPRMDIGHPSYFRH